MSTELSMLLAESVDGLELMFEEGVRRQQFWRQNQCSWGFQIPTNCGHRADGGDLYPLTIKMVKNVYWDLTLHGLKVAWILKWNKDDIESG